MSREACGCGSGTITDDCTCAMPDTPTAQEYDWQSAILRLALIEADSRGDGYLLLTHDSHRLRQFIEQQQATLDAANTRAEELERERDEWCATAEWLAGHALDCHWERDFDDPRGRVEWPCKRLPDVAGEILEAARAAARKEG